MSSTKPLASKEKPLLLMRGATTSKFDFSSKAQSGQQSLLLRVRVDSLRTSLAFSKSSWSLNSFLKVCTSLNFSCLMSEHLAKTFLGEAGLL